MGWITARVQVSAENANNLLPLQKWLNESLNLCALTITHQIKYTLVSLKFFAILFLDFFCNTRVFPKVDYSANIDRIVLFESVGSVVESIFC